MAVIHVFDGLDEKTTYTFSGKLCENITGVDWDNTVILRAGRIVGADYEVQPDDIIFIRKVPTAASTVAIVVGGIALVTAVVGVIYLGVQVYKQRKALESARDAIEASKAAAENTNKLPFVKGARNAAASGRSFPYCIGKSLMTPYRLCPPHYTIAGTNGAEQYYNVVLECGYNDLVINKVKLGETVIKDFGNTTTPQNGQYTFDAGPYYDDRNLIEIRQTGEFADENFNKKIVLTELSTEIPHDHASSDANENARIEAEWKAGVLQDLASNAQSVELIALFDGLQKYEDGWKSASITLQPQWTNVNNPTEDDWHDFDRGFNQNGTYSNTFTYNTKKQIRFAARQDFTAEQAFGKTMKVRVIRTTPKEDGSAKDSVYLLAVQTTCYDAKKSSSTKLVTADVLEENERNKCCRIGVRIVANNNTDGQLDAISVIQSACARTWNGTEWSTEKTPTSNLAAWALELLTSPHHTPSRYNDDELDLDSFGVWYEYCEQQGFKADGVISKAAKKQTVIEKLCSNSNTALVYNTFTGKIETAIDNGRNYSVALLNSDNIISISTAKEFKRKATGKKVTYINAAADYDSDSVVFMRDGEPYDPATDTLTETALEYVTSYEHAFKIAWRQMAEEASQPRIVTVKAGLESAYYPIYSRVELQHRTLKNGIANGIINRLVYRSGLLKEIYLDGFVDFPESGNCGVIINCVSDNGRGLLPLKVTGEGRTNVLEVTEDYRVSELLQPDAGNILSFGMLDENGEFTTVTASMKITNAEETDDGFTLTLVDYNPALYEYGTLPEHRSNLTTVPNSNAQTVEQQRPYVQAGDVQADAAAAAQTAVDVVTKGVQFTNVYRLAAPEMTLEDVIAKIDEDARNASASISMSADEIILQVSDMERELVGLIDIQAGAVTALVEGGGATGQMSLSLNLPAMITPQVRAQLVAASTEAKVAAVYAMVEDTDYYGIKQTATNAAVKALWNDAVKAGLLASQIDLSATQINVGAEYIKITAGTDKDKLMIKNGKIRAALISADDVLANNATISGTLTLGQRGDNLGLVKSSNFNGSFESSGDFKSYGSTGYAITKNGDAAFNTIRVYTANIKDSIIRSRRFYTYFGWENTADEVKTIVKNFLLKIKEYYESVVKIDGVTTDYFIGSMVTTVFKKSGGQENYHATGFMLTNNYNYINIGGFHCTKTGNLDSGRTLGVDVEMLYSYNNDHFYFSVMNSSPKIEITEDTGIGEYSVTIDLMF